LTPAPDKFIPPNPYTGKEGKKKIETQRTQRKRKTSPEGRPLEIVKDAEKKSVNGKK